MNKVFNPVFIGGAGRSGTTLLRVMLNAHRNLCSGPEFKIIPDIIPIYNLLKSEGYSGIMKSYHNEHSDINDIFANFLSGFFDNFQENNGNKRLVEKTPHNVYVMKELGEIFPNAKFIHIVRDGRDVASSLVKMNWFGANNEPVWYVKNIENASKYWIQSVLKGINDANDPILKGRVKLVRYEDLITDPKKVLESVLEFIGEPWDDAVLEYNKVERGFEPVESSTKQVSSTLYDSSKGRWRKDFEIKDVLSFIKMGGGQLLYHLGYEKDLEWAKKINKNA